MAELGPTTFNITIDDTAPQIVYSPLITSSVTPSADLGAGWITFLNGSGFDTFPGEIAIGESLHDTARNNASLTIGFTGECLTYRSLRSGAKDVCVGEGGDNMLTVCIAYHPIAFNDIQTLARARVHTCSMMLSYEITGNDGI